MKPDPILRGDTFYLRRRVPRRFKVVEERSLIWLSLKTDSMTEARRRADGAWAEMTAAWEARIAGDAAAADEQMEAARRIAKTHGVRYRPVDEVAKLPLDELLARIEAATTRDGRLDMTRARALIGGVKPPRITITRAWEIYLEITKDRRTAMTRNQERVWRNARALSIGQLVEAIGDLDLAEIGPDAMLDYREAMWKRVQAGQMKRLSANKRMGEAFAVLRHVNRVRRLGLNLSTEGLRFSDEEKATRLPFSDDWIRDTLLASGALEGLNVEARCILLGMVNTGYRPSEAAELRAEDIRLDAAIPHIAIHGRHRKLKTQHSERLIPLVGVSFEAFRQCPEGFPRYRDSASLTATVNKYLREKGLRETPEHTLYGLRHSFEDRLLAAGVDERIRRDLMGHKLVGRERYGAGARLEQLQRILTEVVI
jgi:integrase